MRTAIIDNATLTAVQRLLGKIKVYNKYDLDGDILAFETLIQAILFFDDIYFINDYKSEYKEDRAKLFYYLKEIDLDINFYEDLLKRTSELSSNIIPEIKGGVFIDENFKPFFDLLKMNNIFTWDMSSSDYFLTQKMLVDPNNILENDKYSELNQMIFNELNDKTVKQTNEKPIFLDSKGNKINSDYKIIDKEGRSKEASIGKKTNLLMANLSWLAFRTIFYTLVGKEVGGSLILHPIRSAFQINFLSKLFPQSNNIFSNLITALNAPVESTVKSIFSTTQPIISKYSLPMFSAKLIAESGNPEEVINAAYHLKYEGMFVEARMLLTEIDNLFEVENNQKGIQKANKLLLNINILMDNICGKYNIKTQQGLSLSPIISVYNMGSVFAPGTIPPIPNYSGKIKILDSIRDLIPQTGFNAVYKSLINDLTSISKLGEYHEKLISKVVYHQNADFYDLKTEDVKYKSSKSGWKIPMD